jgi:hypothetical protein
MYLTVFASAGTAFVFCSFWVYHYVKLDLDADGTGDYGDFDSSTGVGTGLTLVPFTVEVPGEAPSDLKIGRRQTTI